MSANPYEAPKPLAEKIRFKVPDTAFARWFESIACVGVALLILVIAIGFARMELYVPATVTGTFVLTLLVAATSRFLGNKEGAIQTISIGFHIIMGSLIVAVIYGCFFP